MKQKVVCGILLDEQTALSLNDLSLACACSAERIIELVEEGILEPTNFHQTQWQFTGICLTRARTAFRLQRDLGINLAGIGLALDLLEEIEDLKERLYRFEQGDDN